MKRFLYVCLFLFAVVYPSNQQSNESPTYRAGVVEYAPHNGTIAEISAQNLQNYLEIIQQVKNESLDILVFPEATLNRDWAGTTPMNASIHVPSESENVIPCGQDEIYSNILTELSCAAAMENIYIVVNVAEVAYCNETALTNCTETEKVMFNTNVVFDRNGTIISRYRKIHLFGETGFSESDDKKLGIFDTDFGVKFGHFICFDLMFQEPTIQLVDLDIKNFVFPTMWFSELPSLTAVQIQKSVAYTHNVNLLAAGANNPQVGSTGTGIYSGKSGALTSVMSGKQLTKVLISDVPKIPGIENIPMINNIPTKIIRDAIEMDSLYLKSHNMTFYRSGKVDMNKEEQSFNLTYDDVKCNIQVTLNTEFNTTSSGLDHYTYRAVLFNGVRNFDFKTGGVIECGIVACTSENDINSCAHRFASYSNIEHLIEFMNIKINAFVPKPIFNETMKAHNIAYHPVTLLTNIYPIETQDFEYSISDSDNAKYINIEMFSKSIESEFLMFGIFGRNYDKDSLPATNTGSICGNFIYLITGLIILLEAVNVNIFSL